MLVLYSFILSLYKRFHFSNSRLSEIYVIPEMEDECDTCLNPYCHNVTKFHSFWSSYFNIMSTMMGMHRRPCPLIVIFGNLDESGQFNACMFIVMSCDNIMDEYIPVAS